MHKRIAEKLIAALESGDYEKGIGRLRSESNKFCCLGVLCNLHAQAHPEIAARQNWKDHYLGDDSFLPEEVQHWAGMRTRNGLFEDRVLRSLTAINDNRRTFKPVIAALKKHWKKL